MSSSNRLRAAVGALLCAAAVAGCASNPPARTARVPPRHVPAARPVGVDLGELRVTADRGQSADLARRDRYECHNWAIEQSGEAPRAAPTSDDVSRARDRDERAERNERVDRAIAGAAIGGALGGLVRGNRRDSGNDILAGAAVGAAVGAVTTKDRDAGEAGAQPPPQPSGYMRALTACLEGRGYTVSLPAEGEAVAHRN